MYVARLTELLQEIAVGIGALVIRSTPFTLTFEDDANTTLACSLIREHGATLDLTVPVTLATGATVFVGDMIEFAATAETNYDPALTVNGTAVQLDNDGKYKMTVAGPVAAKCIGVESA